MSGEPDFQDYLDEAEDQIGGCHERHPHQRIRLMSELLELAERLERVTTPNIALDIEIENLCAPPTGEPKSYIARKYTASLDAAMTLVPEGWTVRSLSQLEFNEGWQCQLAAYVDTSPRIFVLSDYCSSAAPALCAAALRARAATKRRRG